MDHLLWFVLGIAGAFVAGWVAPRVVGGNRRDRKDRQFLQDLETIVASVTNDVRAHSAEVGVAETELRELIASGDAPALRCAQRMLEANDALQSKLRLAEDRRRRQAEALELQTKRARIDSLTQTFNRRALDEELRNRLEAASQRRDDSTLAMLEVDRFQRFDDARGPAAADAALKGVARCLQSTAPEAFVARYGGETFAILLPSTDPEEVRRTLSRLRTALETLAIRHGDETLSVTATLGAAACSEAESAEGWIELAASGLRYGKRNGGNCCVERRGDRIFPIERGAERDSQEAPTALDEITGLSSRRALAADLERLIAFAKRKEAPAIVLQIRLVAYETYLDRSGFAAAERTLCEAASIIRSSLRDSDHAGRVGPSLFAILLRDADERRGSIALARFREAFAERKAFPLEVSLTLRPIADDAAADEYLRLQPPPATVAAAPPLAESV